MKPIILALLALLAVNVDSYWTPCECPKYPAVVPGAEVAIAGFDITQLTTSTEREFGSIFAYTYSGKCMRDSFSDTCYVIPEELTLYDIGTSYAKSVEDMFYDSYDYVSTYSKSYTCTVGTTFPYFGASYSYHEELYESHEYLSMDYVVQGFGYSAEYLYHMIMPPAYELIFDPMFERSLNDLPSVISSSRDNDEYNQFIEGYGTGYVTDVTMGGKVQINQYCDQYLSQTYSESWEYTQMSITFKAAMFTMQTGQAANSSEYQTSEDYQKHSSVEMYCTGGDIKLPCASNDWMLSVSKIPAYLKITYLPLYMLVYDDEVKRETLKNQIDQYTRTGSLPQW
jgi:hypothetical protein